ncbi:diaminopimelate decarboxylase [Piscinibacterium candidicorallinum]|uniref:Diaminopimelate decarboxylase n=1 Tax=Piscinibacterium candidicorallinum TaxID=1793872 RepID=A0ABV7H7I5_9BURK
MSEASHSTHPTRADRSRLPNPHLADGPAGLALDGVALADIARQFGTPTYVYSARALRENFASYQQALAGRKHRVCYAMKANSNLSILKLLAGMGAGFDIVSAGELARVLAAGGDPAGIVFSGVGKQVAEIEAALNAGGSGIGCFNVESATELARIEQVAARLGKRAPVSFRVNPDVDPKTHPYISTGLKDNKFGVAFGTAIDLYRRAAASAHLKVVGIDCHIGSQIIDPAPFMEALDKMLDLVEQLEREGIVIEHFDLGGGLGITYRDEAPPTPAQYLAPILARFDARGHGSKTFMLEPGRSIVGNAGLLLSTVQVIKQAASKRFCIVDAAMNDYMRPAMYGAYSEIVEVAPQGDAAVHDVVGPVCESGDWLGRDRLLAVAEGDLLALLSAGAYGMSMASNYNTRGRAAEVLVDAGQVRLIRRRETIDMQLADELAALQAR